MSTLTPTTGLYRSIESVRFRATELLDSLGDSSDLVARRLSDAGALGVRGSTCTCPVATYLLRSDLHPMAVDIDGAYALLDFPNFAAKVEVDLPAAVGEFVEQFDLGSYAYVDQAYVTFVDHLHGFDRLTLAHWAESAEALPSSPLVARMRIAIADEQARRAGCGYTLPHPSHDFAYPDEDRDGEFGPDRWCDGVPGDWRKPTSTGLPSVGGAA